MNDRLLKKIILEEIQKVLQEQPIHPRHTKMAVKKLKDRFSYKIVSDLDDDASAEELADVIHSIVKKDISLEKLTMLKSIYLMGIGRHLSRN